MIKFLQSRWSSMLIGLFALLLGMTAVFGQVNTAKAASGDLASIAIAPADNQIITAGETREFTAQGFDQYNNPIPGLSYNWSGANNGVFNQTATGTYDVYAYIGSLTSNHVIVTVNPVSALNSIAISPADNQTIVAGQTIQFFAQGFDQYNNPIPGLTYTWHGTDTNGLFKSTPQGVYEVYASVGTMPSNHVTVSVNRAALDNILVTPVGPGNITAGQTLQFIAQGYDTYDNPIPGLTYTWQNTTTSGLFNNTVSGTYQVSAAVGAIQSNHVSVTVNPAAVASLNISPASATAITPGGSLEVSATARDAYGNLVADGTVVSWTRSNPIFTLSAPNSQTFNGIARVTLVAPAQSAVSTTVTASANPVVTSGLITTSGTSVLTFINVTPVGPVNLVAGQTIQFTAQGFDQYNNPIPGLTYTWYSTDANGLFTNTAAGTINVYASSGTVNSNTVIVNVNHATANHFTISAPANAIAGTSFNILITAYDQYNNIVTDFNNPTLLSGLNTSPQGNLPDYGGSIVFSNGRAMVSITGYAAGVQSITAGAGPVTGTSNSIDFEAGNLFSIVISTTQPTTIIAGQTVLFTANSFDQYGNGRTVDTFTWNNTSAVNSGLFNNTIPGVYPVQAFSNGIPSNIINVTVNPNTNLASIVIVPSSSQIITAGQTIQFTAQGFDQYNNPISGLSYQWVNTDGGLFNQTMAGIYDVYAYIGSVRSNHVLVSVNPGPTTAVYIFPDTSQTIVAGQTINFFAIAVDQYFNFTSDALVWFGTSSSDSGLFSSTVAGSHLVYVRAGAAESIRVIVIVNSAPASSVVFVSFPSAIQVDDQYQFRVKVYDNYGNEIIGTPLVWSVESQGGEGTIDSNGVFKATRAGKVIITVQTGNISQRIEITISEKSPAAPSAEEPVKARKGIIPQTQAASQPNEKTEVATESQQGKTKGTEIITMGAEKEKKKGFQWPLLIAIILGLLILIGAYLAYYYLMGSPTETAEDKSKETPQKPEKPEKPENSLSKNDKSDERRW